MTQKTLAIAVCAGCTLAIGGMVGTFIHPAQAAQFLGLTSAGSGIAIVAIRSIVKARKRR